MLRVLGDGRYLIQFDPLPPGAARDPAALDALAQADAVLAEIGEPPVDRQEPFPVPGSELTYMGDLEGGEA